MIREKEKTLLCEGGGHDLTHSLVEAGLDVMLSYLLDPDASYISTIPNPYSYIYVLLNMKQVFGNSTKTVQYIPYVVGFRRNSIIHDITVFVFGLRDDKYHLLNPFLLYCCTKRGWLRFMGLAHGPAVAGRQVVGRCGRQCTLEFLDEGGRIDREIEYMTSSVTHNNNSSVSSI